MNLRNLLNPVDYAKLMAHVEKVQPVVPNWEVDTITGKDNADEWRKKSAMREGFDLALSLFIQK